MEQEIVLRESYASLYAKYLDVAERLLLAEQTIVKLQNDINILVRQK